MAHPLGTFVGGKEITAKELKGQPGKFGYLYPHELQFLRNKVFVQPSATIRREAFGETLRVTNVKGEFHIEFVGFEGYHWVMGAPSGEVIPVVEIKAGGKKHRQWSDKLEYVSLGRMPVKSKGFIYHHQLKKQGDKQSTHRGAGVQKKGGAGLLPIRRLSDCHYEVELTRGNWVELVVN